MSNLLIGLLSRWVDFVERNARKTLVVLILISIAAGIVSLMFSRINSDVSRLVKPSDALAWYRDNEDYKLAFPDLQQTAVIVVSGPDSEAVEKSAKRLFTRFRQLPEFDFVFAPAIGEFLNSRKLFFLDLADLDLWIEGAQYNHGPLLRLADSAGLTNAVFTFTDQVSSVRGLPVPESLASLARSFDPARGKPEIRLNAYPRLVDESSETFYQLIILKGQQEHDKSLPNATVVRSIRAVIDSTPAAQGVSVRLTGEIVLADDELNAGLTGIEIAGVLSVILLAIILGVGIRSWRIIGVIFSMLIMGILLTTAFAALAVGSYNVLSLIFVIMFFGLGVDFAVHFALRVKEAIADSGHKHASRIAAEDIGPALLLCMLTTMMAFLSFTPTAYRGLAELGVISAAGMAIAFGLTLTLLPAVFSIRAIKLPSSELAGNKSAAFVLAMKPGIVLVLVTVFSLFAFYYARDVRFDYSVLAIRDAGTEAMSTLLDLQDDNIATDYSISVLVKNDAEAQVLKKKLEALSVVGEVTTPFDFIPAEQAAKKQKLRLLYEQFESIEEVLPSESTNGLAEALQYMEEGISEVRESDQYLVRMLRQGLKAISDDPAQLQTLNQQLFEELNAELKQLRAMLSAEPFGIDDVPDDLRASMITSKGEHLLTVQPAEPLLNRRLTEDFINEVSRVAPNIAGRSVVEWGVGDVVVESFMTAGLLSLMGIFTLLLVYFRSIVLPLFVLVPIFLSILFTFAICQITGISLNMANVLVVPLIIGLGVDTGIHVVHRYTHSSGVESVYNSSTARAVVISGLTTVGTFFSLSFSPHKGAASVGLLLTISISLLLVATFVVLPALLRVKSNYASA